MRAGREVTRKVKLGRLDETPQQASVTRPEQSSAQPSGTGIVPGLTLSAVSADARRRFNIKEGVEGVLVTMVDANSIAAERRFAPGDVIVEVQREAVKNLADIRKRIEALKAAGQKRALFYVASGPEGTLRYVTLPIE
jgi:serine protease Do